MGKEIISELRIEHYEIESVAVEKEGKNLGEQQEQEVTVNLKVSNKQEEPKQTPPPPPSSSKLLKGKRPLSLKFDGGKKHQEKKSGNKLKNLLQNSTPSANSSTKGRRRGVGRFPSFNKK